MFLRDYRPGDLESVAELFTTTVHRVNGRDYTPEQLAVWAPTPPRLERLKAKLESQRVVIADVDGKVTGVVSFELNGHIDLLFVHHEFQRCGIASALHGAAEEESLGRGLRRLFAEVSITARPFFEKAGYRLVREQTVMIDGGALTNFEMEKLIEGK